MCYTETTMEGQKAYIIWGVSGSGKDTQAEKLTTFLKEKGAYVPEYCSVGKNLRHISEKNEQNFFMSEVKKTMNEGGLLPEFVPIWVWTQWIYDVAKPNTHYIFNGVARKPKELPILINALHYLRVQNPLFLVLDVSEEEVIERLTLRGRSDDTEESIKKRIMWYNKENKEAIDGAKECNATVLHIDGEGSVEEVFDRIKKHIQ